MPGGVSPPGQVPDVSSSVLDEDETFPAPRTAGAELAHKRALARARRRAQGRTRSARRLQHEPFAPPPGWQHRPALDGRDVLVDQAAALERVRELVDAERWRADRHQSWSAMLAALIHHMDWETGLATISRDALSAVGGVDVRTVTTMIRWAREVGLLAVVEAGASAAFLGTDRNRAQTYAITVPASAAPPPAGRGETRDEAPAHSSIAGSRTPSDLHGDAKIHPPTSYVKDLTLEERRKDLKTPRQPPHPSWPLWQVPETPAERSAAAATLAERLGIRGRVAAWRLRALLTCWWRAGACPAGLRHAIDHHPDQPDELRGDALRGAHDPIRVLGYRLRPWLGRLDELPDTLHGRRGDYRAAQTARLAYLIDHADHADQATQHRPAAEEVSPPSAARVAARDTIRSQLAARGRRRTTASSRPDGARTQLAGTSTRAQTRT